MAVSRLALTAIRRPVVAVNCCHGVQFSSKRLMHIGSRLQCTPQVAKPKPRATAVASGRGSSSKLKVAGISGVFCGLLGYWGYHLYETKQTPMEWASSTINNAWSSFQDAADPTEEFFRNSLQPIETLRAQNVNGTVILNLEGTLLCRKWDRKHGYRFSKRPHLEELLMTLSQAGFEILLFSDLPTAVAMETVNQLLNSFPPGSISCNGLLAKEHMFFRDGHYVKRLNYLPRDMNKLVLVDHSTESYSWNPRNTLLVKPYTEYDASDDTLKKATQMIMTMRNSGQPYQVFINKYARAEKDEDGVLRPAEDAVERFAAEKRAEARALAIKKRTGVSGVLRGLKSRSSNLRESTVISAATQSVESILQTTPTDTDSKPSSLWERKMARMHKRQREWEAKQKLMAAAEASEK